MIGMVGNIESFLAKQSNIVLNTTVEQEACPNNLAPTSSTTAQLVMGDALAVCLMEIKGLQVMILPNFIPEAPWERNYTCECRTFISE